MRVDAPSWPAAPARQPSSSSATATQPPAGASASADSTQAKEHEDSRILDDLAPKDVNTLQWRLSNEDERRDLLRKSQVADGVATAPAPAPGVTLKKMAIEGPSPSAGSSMGEHSGSRIASAEPNTKNAAKTVGASKSAPGEHSGSRVAELESAAASMGEHSGSHVAELKSAAASMGEHSGSRVASLDSSKVKGYSGPFGVVDSLQPGDTWSVGASIGGGVEAVGTIGAGVEVTRNADGTITLGGSGEALAGVGADKLAAVEGGKGRTFEFTFKDAKDLKDTLDGLNPSDPDSMKALYKRLSAVEWDKKVEGSVDLPGGRVELPPSVGGGLGAGTTQGGVDARVGQGTRVEFRNGLPVSYTRTTSAELSASASFGTSIWGLDGTPWLAPGTKLEGTGSLSVDQTVPIGGGGSGRTTATLQFEGKANGRGMHVEVKLADITTAQAAAIARKLANGDADGAFQLASQLPSTQVQRNTFRDEDRGPNVSLNGVVVQGEYHDVIRHNNPTVETSKSPNAAKASPGGSSGTPTMPTPNGTTAKAPSGASAGAAPAPPRNAAANPAGHALPVLKFDNLKDFNGAANNAEPNTIYEYGRYRWTTDASGRVSAVDTIAEEGGVDLTQHGRKTTGGGGVTAKTIGTDETRGAKEGDVGFHLIADSFNGPTNRLNVVAANGKSINGFANLNQGAYRSMEDWIRTAAKEAGDGKVEIKIRAFYDDKTARPSELVIAFKVEGSDEGWLHAIFRNDEGGWVQ
jgi:hypothetical protein